MKIVRYLILTISVISLTAIAESENIELYKFYENIAIDARTIIKSMPVVEDSAINKFGEYFENSTNVFSGGFGSTVDVSECDLLYLKPSCIKHEYGHEEEFYDGFGCLYIYGMPKFKLDSDKYMIQKTILFKKDNNSWKILGSRFSGLLLTDFVSSYFKEDTALDMFTKSCRKYIRNIGVRKI